MKVDEDGSIWFRQSFLETAMRCNERGRLSLVRPEFAETTNDSALIGTAAHAAIAHRLEDKLGTSEIGDFAHQVAIELCATEQVQWTKWTLPAQLGQHAMRCAEAWDREICPHVPKGGLVEVSFKVPLFESRGRQVGLEGTIDYASPDGTLYDWKGLAIDTPLPTPTGWTTMGEVVVGDQLLGVDGLPTEVIGTSTVKWVESWRVAFIDGSSIITDNEHRWRIERSGCRSRIVTTPGLVNVPRPFWINAPHAVKLPEVDLPMDPYVLGYWLGDGTTGKGELTVGTVDEDAVALAFAERGYRTIIHHNPNRATTIVCPALREDLGAVGVLKSKHVPRLYLRGSIDQRMELLRGLLDSDGCWTARSSGVAFDNTNFALTDAVIELASSFGWSTSVWDGQARRDGRPFGRPYRRVTIYPLTNPFTLARKARRFRPCSVKGARRYVKSVEPLTVTVPTRCLAVDTPDHLYLAGPRWVPTHNTSSKKYDQRGKQRVAIQPTVYATAAMHGSLGGDTPYQYPIKFWFGVMVRGEAKATTQLVPVMRTQAHEAWLTDHLRTYIDIADALGVKRPWQRNEDHFLCNSTYCPWYSICKGARLSDRDNEWRP